MNDDLSMMEASTPENGFSEKLITQSKEIFFSDYHSCVLINYATCTVSSHIIMCFIVHGPGGSLSS